MILSRQIKNNKIESKSDAKDDKKEIGLMEILNNAIPKMKNRTKVDSKIYKSLDKNEKFSNFKEVNNDSGEKENYIKESDPTHKFMMDSFRTYKDLLRKNEEHKQSKN